MLVSLCIVKRVNCIFVCEQDFCAWKNSLLAVCFITPLCSYCAAYQCICSLYIVHFPHLPIPKSEFPLR